MEEIQIFREIFFYESLKIGQNWSKMVKISKIKDFSPELSKFHPV
jgi:hypothetical protein